MDLLLLKRRDFLKATAVSGVAAALGASAVPGLTRAGTAGTPAEPVNKIVKTNCRACIANCGVLAHVKDGRVIKLEGNPEFPMNRGAMCAKGLSGIQALYHPNRNKYPMRRVGARGEGKWMRISWDEAFDTIARKLLETSDKYGAEAVLCSTGGGGNPQFNSTARFCNAFGTPNWFEPGCAQCYMPRQMTYHMMYGGGPWGNTSIADSNCLELFLADETPIKTLVMWGTDPSYSAPASGGRAVNELRVRGVKTVVIDPRLTPDAAKADIWLAIRPGTDVALMMAWVKYLIDKKLYDGDFVVKWTNLPFLVNTKTKMLLRESDLVAGGDPKTFVVWDRKSKSARAMSYPWDDKLDPALSGTFSVKGVECKTGFQLLKERVQPFTLAKAAEICWLDAAKIEEAIRLYAENSPSGLSLGVATDQSPNSTQAVQGAAILDMICGNVERPGSTLQRFHDGNGKIDGLRITQLKKLLPEEQLRKRLGGIEYKGLLWWWAAQPAVILSAILTGQPYRPRVWIERSGNKFVQVANAGAWEEAAKQMEMIVHVHLYPTSFSAYADILIPAAEWLETDYIVPATNRLFARQHVTHLWETMNETMFWAKLAKRCADLGHEGCKRAFDPQVTAPEIPYQEKMEGFLNAWTGSFLGMTWAEFASKYSVEYCTTEEWKRYYLYLKTDPNTGKPRGFGTPSKKLELYLESLITLGRTGMPFSTYPLPPSSQDYDPLPYYMEPAEGPNTKAVAKDYPLVMTNGRLPIYHHGTQRNVPWLREIYPVPEIWVNPKTATTYGIAQGDWVWVESPRGKTQAKALLTEGIPPQVVYMERFWFPETLDTPTHGWREMNVNLLTKNTAPFNDVCGTYTLRGFQVRISKADGPPVGIWQEPSQFKVWLPEPSDPTPQVEN